jgi:aspartate carbamoyltransferase catalytic subunit
MTTETERPAGGDAPTAEPIGPGAQRHHEVWRHRHVLDVDDFSLAEIELAMTTTAEMKEILSRPIKKVPTLRGTSVTIIFWESSTRTRVSFEVAAKNLSADVVNIAAQTSSVTKGESLVDTIRTIEALGADMIVMRHGTSGAPYLAAQHFGGNVLNGGDGWHAHPTQALLDLYTMRERLPGGSVRGRKVVIVGDVLHSRVARSNIWTLTKSDADLWLCGPPTLLTGFEAWARATMPGSASFTVTSDIGRAVDGADVVMALRIQKERQEGGLLPPLREYTARFGLTRERMARAAPDALVMHPGPMNEGLEIMPEVATGTQSVITDQVTNGVAVRMALLFLVSGPRDVE